MCTVFFAYRMVEGLPLVVASNRDEFFDRPTQTMTHWDEAPQVLAGRDLRANGTWLGVNLSGAIAFITNFRNPKEQGQHFRSRGRLPAHFLKEQPPIESFSKELEAEADQYRGYNMVFGSPEALYYFSNKKKQVEALKPGVYGLSNHLLDTPWPKVQRGKSQLSQWADDAGKWDPSHLFEILNDRQIAADDELPDTGVGLGWERLLSATFIETLSYGTRNSTVIRFHENNQVDVEEWSWQKPASEPKKCRFQFAING